MLEVHAILHRQRCYENMIEKTGILSDAYQITGKAIKEKLYLSFYNSLYYEKAAI